MESGSIDFDHVFRYNEKGPNLEPGGRSTCIPSKGHGRHSGRHRQQDHAGEPDPPALVHGGSVRVGGHNVKEYSWSTCGCLRHGAAKEHLFSGTIRDNLRWGDTVHRRRNAQRLPHCLRAEEFIEKMPDGYDTYIEQGGTNVSGGQRSVCA